MATIWITGGKGFIGRHLAKLAAAQGNSVFGVGHGEWPAEGARWWGFNGWVAGEVDTGSLSHMLQASGVPDVVYHLAGGSSVGASIQNPYEDFCSTVGSSARLFEWLRLNAAAARVVCVSSAAVYGAKHTGPIAENSVTSPYSPYGTHKSMMESLCHSYAENFGLRVAIVRLFSVYGAGLEKQLIWDLCCKLAHGESGPIMLGGSGGELRDWLHVSDAAELLWLVRTMCEEGCPIINGGTGVATSIRDIAGLVCQAWGKVPGVEFSGVARKGDPVSLIADCGLATRIGFEPRVPLAEGIDATVRWFRSRK